MTIANLKNERNIISVRDRVLNLQSFFENLIDTLNNHFKNDDKDNTTFDDNKEEKKMNLEEMQKQLQKLKNDQQDKFIDNLKDMVDNLYTKSLLSDYKPTNHERVTFEYIRETLNQMLKWF